MRQAVLRQAMLRQAMLRHAVPVARRSWFCPFGRGVPLVAPSRSGPSLDQPGSAQVRDVRERFGEREVALEPDCSRGEQFVGDLGHGQRPLPDRLPDPSSRRILLRVIASIRRAQSPNGRPWPGNTCRGSRSAIAASESR